MRVPFGSLPDTILETILGGFWGPFGEPWGVTLGKKGVQKGIQKMMQKTGLRVIWGETRFVPINNHSSSPGASRDRWIVDCKTKAPATPHRASGTVADIVVYYIAYINNI